MKSPFPGMDPYIEQSGFFRDFHSSMNYVMRAQINAELPSGYIASLEERVLITPPGRGIMPDIFIVRKPREQTEPVRGGGTAVLTPTEPHQIEPLASELHESFIEIRSGEDWSEVVTVIELLSPTNKLAGPDRNKYRRKQRSLLCSKTSLLEIDLLRDGAHTVTAPIAEKRTENNWHYIVSSNLHWRRELIDYWPVTVRESLPIIRVPLKSSDENVMLDLQAAFDRVYAEGVYSRRTDYRQEPPDPPFVGADVLWIDTLLRNAGLRTAQDSARIAGLENSEGSV